MFIPEVIVMKKALLWLVVFLCSAPCLTQVKLPLTHAVPGGFTVSSIEILTIPPTFFGQDVIEVGVRINFMRVIAQGAADSFDLKEGEVRLMSLRLIGLKLSETETNQLVYHGPSSVFPSSYQYGGFQIVGFYVTKADLDAGYKEIWGWRPASPLACRSFRIVVDLDLDPVYGQPMSGVHKGTQAEWACEQKTSAPGQRCQFSRKDSSPQQVQRYYQTEKVLDVMVEPEPFEAGQELKLTIVVDSQPTSQPWEQYIVYRVTVKYQNGQTATIPHSYGTFNPNLAIVLTSVPKTNDVRNFILDRVGPISYTVPEPVKIPAGSIVEVEIRVQIWAGLDVDRFRPYEFVKRWIAKTLFVPASR